MPIGDHGKRGNSAADMRNERLAHSVLGSYMSSPRVDIRRHCFTATSPKHLPSASYLRVFLTTPHSYALVNLKPLIPGHILVCPLKSHLRLTDLSPAETADLFSTVQLAQRMLAQKYLPEPGNLLSGSFTVAVQDGPDSGQTVPHLHVHVIPRRKGDVGHGPDAIYVKMSTEDGNIGGALWDRERRPAPAGRMPRIDDADRHPRTEEQMEEEAEEYKSILRKLGIA